MSYLETETPASRVIYINSGDATTTYGGIDSDFDFTLEEPIIVPPHHSILMSVYSAEIPFTFYNFQDGINTRLDYFISPFGTVSNYDANGFMTGFTSMTLPQGNYTTTQLAKFLRDNIESFGVKPLNCVYDVNKLKFKFSCNTPNFRITLALKNGVSTGTKTSPGDDMNEELGFDFDNITGDPFVELNGAGTQYFFGYTNATVDAFGNIVPGAGTDISVSGPHLVETFLVADDAADVSNSVRSLFLRTNLSSTSILDSHIGGGFSNILCRVPINVDPGQIINIQPVNGNVHKLLLKVKAITNISMRLTNQKNRTVNLNGLDFDVSLKLDFMENKNLSVPKTLRIQLQEFEKEQQEKLLENKKKTKTKIKNK